MSSPHDRFPAATPESGRVDSKPSTADIAERLAELREVLAAAKERAGWV